MSFCNEFLAINPFCLDKITCWLAPSSLRESFGTNATSSGWPSCAEQADERVTDSQHGCRSHWTVKMLALHVQSERDSYRHDTALQIPQAKGVSAAALREDSRHAMLSSQRCSSTAAPQYVQEGVKQINPLSLKSLFFFQPININRKLLPPTGAPEILQREAGLLERIQGMIRNDTAWKTQCI